jgi:integrase
MACIREIPRGSRIWWVDYRDAAGNRRREKAITERAAKQLLAARLVQVKKGEDIRSHRLWTFGQLANGAIEYKKLRLAPATIKTDLVRLGQLLPLIGRLPSDRCTPERIDQVLGSLKRQNELTNSTVNRYRSLISSVFAWAKKMKHVPLNPVAAGEVKRYKENDQRRRWLTDQEEAAIRAYLTPAQELQFDLALQTGMRRGEQYDLRWDGVDFERRIITVKGKTGRHDFPANEKAIRVLYKLKELSGDQEFVRPGGRTQRDWTRWLEKAAAQAGVKDFHWHDLRHTFASRLIDAGEGLPAVQALLGHKDIRTTMRYAHLFPGHLRAAAEKATRKVKEP